MLMILPGLAWGQSLKIRIYKTSSVVDYYSTQKGDARCALGVNEMSSAELLEQTADMIHVRFEKPINGCVHQLLGRNMNEGWIPKSQVTYASDENETLQPTSRSQVTQTPQEPCPPETATPEENIASIGDAITGIMEETSGMKSEADLDKYLACYPQTEQGNKNYAEYKPVIDTVTEVFQANLGLGDIQINKTLFTCLLRRESGFDPKAGSHTGAMGLGQHTSINIEHISNRLKSQNSWEKHLWDRFFAQMSQTEQGRKLLAECPQTKNGAPATFNNKEDAACPLNSMAASAIYNIQVQQALRRTTNLREVQWEDQMTYQLAIGATYNLGDGAASRAVDDLELDGWLKSLRDRSPLPEKRQEVANHIEALKNCMQRDNWKPMHPNDPPQCELPQSPAQKKTPPMPVPRPKDL